MKIYCILFDTFPRHPEMEKLFKSKGLHFGDYLTQPDTVTTLISMFSGHRASEMRDSGIGHSHTYALLSDEDKAIWDEKILFKHLPEDWNIHLHSMPNTRGDDNSIHDCWPMYNDPNTKPGLRDCKLLPDDICGRVRDFIFYNYQEGDDERNFIKNMQDLPSDENHLVVLKYNHYHDAERGKQEDVFSLFKNIVETIDFKEDNSLFWIFADHGEPQGITKNHNPPDSFLAWVSVTDNITNKKVTKSKIASIDFKNNVLNRVFNKNLPNDVLDELDMDRIYVTEDSRAAVNEYNCTSVSAITALDEDKYVQYCMHNGGAPDGKYDGYEEVARIYERKYGTEGDLGVINRTWEDINFKHKTIIKLKDYLMNGIWRWYFTNE
tara:strand:+ start:2541 stop:3677 length:1137 start_codon:yes stop_codon:yes gene_type:complete